MPDLALLKVEIASEEAWKDLDKLERKARNVQDAAQGKRRSRGAKKATDAAKKQTEAVQKQARSYQQVRSELDKLDKRMSKASVFSSSEVKEVNEKLEKQRKILVAMKDANEMNEGAYKAATRRIERMKKASMDLQKTTGIEQKKREEKAFKQQGKNLINLLKQRKKEQEKIEKNYLNDIREFEKQKEKKREQDRKRYLSSLRQDIEDRNKMYQQDAENHRKVQEGKVRQLSKAREQMWTDLQKDIEKRAKAYDEIVAKHKESIKKRQQLEAQAVNQLKSRLEKKKRLQDEYWQDRLRRQKQQIETENIRRFQQVKLLTQQWEREAKAKREATEQLRSRKWERLKEIIESLGKNLQKTKQGFTTFGKKIKSTSDIQKKTRRTLGDLSEAYFRLTKNILSQIQLWGILGGVIVGAQAAYAGLAAFMLKVISDMEETAKVLNMNVQALQKFQLAANVVGIKSQDLNDALKDLNSTVYDAIKGQDSAREAFDALNIEMDTLIQRGNDTEAMFRLVLQRLSEIDSTTKRMNVAQEVFGKTQGTEILNLVGNLDKALNVAEQFNLLLSQDTVQAATKAWDSIRLLWNVIKNQFISAAAEASEEIQKITNRFLQLASQGNIFKGTIVPAVRFTVAAIEKLSVVVKKLYQGLHFLYQNAQLVKEVLYALGGIALSNVIGGWIASLRSLIAKFGLARAAGMALIGTLKVLSKITIFYGLFRGIVKLIDYMQKLEKVTGSWTTAALLAIQDFLNTLVDKTPKFVEAGIEIGEGIAKGIKQALTESLDKLGNYVQDGLKKQDLKLTDKGTIAPTDKSSIRRDMNRGGPQFRQPKGLWEKMKNFAWWADEQFLGGSGKPGIRRNISQKVKTPSVPYGVGARGAGTIGGATAQDTTDEKMFQFVDPERAKKARETYKELVKESKKTKGETKDLIKTLKELWKMTDKENKGEGQEDLRKDIERTREQVDDLVSSVQSLREEGKIFEAQKLAPLAIKDVVKDIDLIEKKLKSIDKRESPFKFAETKQQLKNLKDLREELETGFWQRSFENALTNISQSAKTADSLKDFADSFGQALQDSIDSALSSLLGATGQKIGRSLGQAIGGAAGASIGGPIGGAIGSTIGSLATEAYSAAQDAIGRETYQASVRSGATVSEFGELSESITKSKDVLSDFKDENTGLLASMNTNLQRVSIGIEQTAAGIAQQADIKGLGAGQAGVGLGRKAGAEAYDIGAATVRTAGTVASDIGTFGMTYAVRELAENLGGFVGDLVKLPEQIMGELGSEAFGGDVSVKQRGIQIGRKETPLRQIRRRGISARGYAKIKEEGGWFSSGDTDWEFQELNRRTRNGLNNIFKNVSDTIFEQGKALGADMEEVLSYTFDPTKLNLKDLSTKKKREKIQSYISKQMNVATEELFTDVIGKYQKVDEEISTTATRVLRTKQVFVNAFEDMEISLGNSAQDIVETSQQLKQAFGNVQKGQQLLSGFYEAFAPEELKTKNVKEDVQGLFDELNRQIPDTKAGLIDVAQSFDLDTEQGRKNIAMLTSHTSQLKDFYGVMEEGTKNILSAKSQMQQVIGNELPTGEKLLAQGIGITELGKGLGSWLKKESIKQAQDFGDTSRARRISGEVLYKRLNPKDKADYIGTTRDIIDLYNKEKITKEQLSASTDILTQNYNEIINKEQELANERQEIADFNQNLTNIIKKNTLSDLQYQIYELNQWYSKQKSQAQDLGIELDKLNKAHKLRLQNIKEEYHTQQVQEARSEYQNAVQEKYNKLQSKQNELEQNLSDAKSTYVSLLKDEVSTIENNLSDAKSAYLDKLKEERSEVKNTAQEMGNLITSLKEYQSSIISGSESPVGRERQFAFARSEFQSTLQLARQGEQDAMKNLQDVSSSYLESARSVGRGGNAFAEVQKALNATQVLAKEEKSEAEKQSNRLKQQINQINDFEQKTISQLKNNYLEAKNIADSKLPKLENKLDKFNTNITSLSKAQNKFQNAQMALDNWNQQHDIKWFEQEINRLDQIKNGTLGIQQALSNYQTALTGAISSGYSNLESRFESRLEALREAQSKKESDASFAGGGTISGPESGYTVPTTFHGTEHITTDSQMGDIKEQLKAIKEVLTMMMNTEGEQNKYAKKMWQILDGAQRGNEPISVENV